MLHLLCWYVSNRQPHGCRPGVSCHRESGGKPCKVLKLGLKQVSSRRHDLVFNLVFNTATGHWIINIRSAWARLIPTLLWRRGQVLPGSVVCSRFAMRTCSPAEPAGCYQLPPVGPLRQLRTGEVVDVAAAVGLFETSAEQLYCSCFRYFTSPPRVLSVTANSACSSPGSNRKATPRGGVSGN